MDRRRLRVQGKKKTARTVNCPCREASDATCEGWSAIQVVLSGAASFLNSYRMPQNQPRCTKYLHFPYIFSGQSSKFHRYRPKARRTKSRNWRENSYFGLILKNNGDLAPGMPYYAGLILATWDRKQKEIMKTSRERHMQESGHDEIAGTSPKDSGDSGARRGRWSTAFLIAGSAILGATAVAFWNRRTIAKMRIQFPAESTQPRPQAHADEEIF